MTIDKYLEESQVSLETLQHAFARSCKICGLEQSSCFALILLLYSRWQLLLMLAWMLQEEDKGRHPDTTEVVLMAEKIHEAWIRKTGHDDRIS